jgi:hypothetical protein
MRSPSNLRNSRTPFSATTREPWLPTQQIDCFDRFAEVLRLCHYLLFRGQDTKELLQAETQEVKNSTAQRLDEPFFIT